METQGTLRLCHIYKWHHFEGFGFNLHAEKGKAGQFIGKVDEGSPAEAAGLKEGDRIIEVNGINISQDSHKLVVQRIKSLKYEAKLLVVDSQSEAIFKSQNITLHGGLPFVITLTTPASSKGKLQSVDCKETEENDLEDASTIKKNQLNQEFEAGQDLGLTMAGEDETNGSNSKDDKTNNSLRLNMTAKELRAQLAARPRYDPKSDSSIDLRQKYDIVQRL